MSIDPMRDPHAHIVVKPLPSQVAAAKAKVAGAEADGRPGSAGAKAAACPGAAGRVGAAGVGATAAGGLGAAGEVGVGSAGATGSVPPSSASPRIASSHVAPDDPFLRAANEDDDGYDPYSDRPAPPEPLFQEDPWA